MKRFIRTSMVLGVLVGLALPGRGQAAEAERNAWTVASPDGAVVAQVKASAGWQLTVRRDTHEVLLPSPVGITLKQGGAMPGPLQVIGTRRTVIDETYAMPVGKRSPCRNHANELTLDFGEGRNVRFSLILRAYNEGVAYRYLIEGTGEETVMGEASAFRIPADSKLWCGKYVNHYQAFYGGARKLGDLTYPVQVPMLFQSPTGCWGYITEAAVDGAYAGARLKVDAAAGLVSLELEGQPTGKLPWATPWRVMFVVSDLAQLVESTLVANLNPPCAISDTRWIKPGVAVFPWLPGLAASGDFWNCPDLNRAKQFIDLAAELGWGWIEFDNGIIKVRPGNDVEWTEQLVAYAASKNVAVYGWDWVSEFSDAGKRAKYLDWLVAKGYKGVKVDFLDSDAQSMYCIREEIARDCAARKLLVSYHGDITPRGMQRTWPNIATHEGVSGEEEWGCGRPISPIHNVNLVFTRNVPGSMDYTPTCIEWDGKGVRQSSNAHEMALPVVFESGWTSMGLSPESARSPAGQKVTAFLKNLPTAWDDTRFLGGAPDEFVVVARRKGADWWIAGINAGTARTVRLRLDFLKARRFGVLPRRYAVQLYHDDPATVGQPPVKTLISVTPLTLDPRQPLEVALAANGGFGLVVRDSR